MLIESGYCLAMFSWLDDPKAGYVLAAYGVTAVALLWLLAATVRDGRRKKADLEKIKQQSPTP